MPSDIFQQFFANLQASIKLYGRLVEVAQRKREHILANDVEGLREDLKVEQELAGIGTELDLQRPVLHKRCCAEVKAQGARTLAQLCTALPEPWKQRFISAREQLRDLAARLHELNRVNVALVNNSLDLMSGLLTAMFNTEQTAAYGKSGVRVGAEIPFRTLEVGA